MPLTPNGAAHSSQSNLLLPIGGFTLLEVLISSAILLIITILLIGMADHTTSLWHRGERSRDSSRELRAGLEMITEDLHSAVITTNPNTFVVSNETSLPGGSRLFFLVSHPGEKQSTDSKGDLSATGYFIAADPKIKGTSNLYRFHAAGNIVSDALEKNKLQDLYQSANPTNAATTELLARRIVKLDVRRLEGKAVTDGLLLVSLSTLRNDRSTNNTAILREDQFFRYTTLLRLPPEREIPATNSF